MDRERSIFPTLLNRGERQLLRQLNTESGQSMSACLRTLLYKEFSTRQLSGAKAKSGRQDEAAKR